MTPEKAGLLYPYTIILLEKHFFATTLLLSNLHAM